MMRLFNAQFGMEEAENHKTQEVQQPSKKKLIFLDILVGSRNQSTRNNDTYRS